MTKYLSHSYFFLSLIAWVLSSFSTAHALSSAEKKVRQLHRHAMQAYVNLDIITARDTLREALVIIQKGKVRGEFKARIHVSMATVEIAGFQDNATGLEHCIEALRADPTIAPDPALSTPEVQTIFNLAKARVHNEQNKAPPTTTGPPAGVSKQVSFPGNIPHVPVPEQLENTSIPVFVEVPDDAAVAKIELYYRSKPMPRYERLMMWRMPGGFGAEIPCEDAYRPEVRYTIVAYDEEGERLGYAGTKKQPVVIPLVEERRYPAPSLPGRKPPKQCVFVTCEPGTPNCAANPAPAFCQNDDQCADDMQCHEGKCRPAPDEPKEEEISEEELPDPPSFFLQLAGGVGWGLAQTGQPSDGPPRTTNTSDPNMPYIPGGDDCSAQFCVRVLEPGFLPVYAMRAIAGWYFIDRLGVALWMRYQFNSGRTAQAIPSNLQFGGRLQLRITKPRATGFELMSAVGMSFGQIQIKPDQAGASEEPYIDSGLNGAQLGVTATWRFWKYFGISLTQEFMFQFPNFLFVMETYAGVEVSF